MDARQAVKVVQPRVLTDQLETKSTRDPLPREAKASGGVFFLE
jgi:hypothetical protein